MSEKVEDLNLVIDTLDGKIKDKKIQLDSLDAQIHQKQVKFETDKKMATLEDRKKIDIERVGYSKELDKIQTREQYVLLKEKELQRREKEVDGREQHYLQIEGNQKKLLEERSNFIRYKQSVQEEFENARDTIAEAGEVHKEIKARSDGLDGREVSIKNKEKRWNDQIGYLEQKIRNFETEKANFEAMKKEAEYVTA